MTVTANENLLTMNAQRFASAVSCETTAADDDDNYCTDGGGAIAGRSRRESRVDGGGASTIFGLCNKVVFKRTIAIICYYYYGAHGRKRSLYVSFLLFFCFVKRCMRKTRRFPAGKANSSSCDSREISAVYFLSFKSTTAVLFTPCGSLLITAAEQ